VAALLSTGFVLGGTTKAFGQRNGAPMLNNREKELRQLEDEWLSCYVSGDKATYDRIVADEFTGTDEAVSFVPSRRIGRSCQRRL
jgi:hypothetical protein